MKSKEKIEQFSYFLFFSFVNATMQASKRELLRPGQSSPEAQDDSTRFELVQLNFSFVNSKVLLQTQTNTTFNLTVLDYVALVDRK
jgi:hypothetical protein